jgi:hypothetical protein
MPSAIRRTKKASGIIQSEFKNLRTRGTVAVTLRVRLKD